MKLGTKRVKQEVGQNDVQPNNNPPLVQQVKVKKVTLQTLQTIDASNVPEQHMPVIDTLTKLVNNIYVGLGGSYAEPDKKLEIEDNSQKISVLFGRLNSKVITGDVVAKLVVICEALDRRDFSTVFEILAHLSINHGDECEYWLAALKRMLNTSINLDMEKLKEFKS